MLVIGCLLLQRNSRAVEHSHTFETVSLLGFSEPDQVSIAFYSSNVELSYVVFPDLPHILIG